MIISFQAAATIVTFGLLAWWLGTAASLVMDGFGDTGHKPVLLLGSAVVAVLVYSI